MKMQNAEMEFVTFDAQDVIATSGGVFSLNPNSTYKLYGIADRTAKNGYIEETDLGGTTYRWNMFEEDTASAYPNGITNDTKFYLSTPRSTNKDIGTIRGFDETGRAISSYDTITYKWLENFFINIEYNQ